MLADKEGETMNQNRTTVERSSERELVITRTFSAPADLVFSAWTKPEYVKRWWAPASRGVTIVECVAELRPGGTYRYVLEHGNSRFAFTGRYLEIAAPTRLVYTQSFEPVVGEPLPGEAVVTITFEERDGSTTLVSHEAYPSREVLDGVLESGMEDGMRETYEQFEALVASLLG